MPFLPPNCMVHDCLFIYIAAGRHIWRSFPYPPPGDAAGSLLSFGITSKLDEGFQRGQNLLQVCCCGPSSQEISLNQWHVAGESRFLCSAGTWLWAVSVGLPGYCPRHYSSMHPPLSCRGGQLILSLHMHMLRHPV